MSSNLSGVHGIERDTVPLAFRRVQRAWTVEANNGSATMLYIGLGILGILLSYVFVKALHHADPNAQPHAPLHDTKLYEMITGSNLAQIAEGRSKPVFVWR